MSWIMRGVLLGTFAIIASAASAQAPIEGIYWKPGDTVTSQDIPRVASDSQFPPDPYYEVDMGLRVPRGLKDIGAGMSAVRFDSHGNIWTLNGGDPPISEFDPSGRYIKSLGQGKEWFVYPHFLYIDKSDNLWVASSGARPGKGNDVLKISPDGEVLLTLGKPGVEGGSPENFMGPDGVVVAPDGKIFVTDGHFVEPDGGGREMAGKYFNWEQGSWGVTTRGLRSFLRMGSSSNSGEEKDLVPGSSTFLMASPWIPRGGCSSPTAVTIGFRFSIKTANCWGYGNSLANPAMCSSIRMTLFM